MIKKTKLCTKIIACMLAVLFPLNMITVFADDTVVTEIDNFNDYSMIYEKDNVTIVKLNEEQNGAVPDGASRVRKSVANDNLSGTLVYRAENIGTVSVYVYQDNIAQKPAIEVSADKKTWTKLEASSGKEAVYRGRIYYPLTAENTVSDAKYVRIVIGTTSRGFDSVQLCKVQLECSNLVRNALPSEEVVEESRTADGENFSGVDTFNEGGKFIESNNMTAVSATDVKAQVSLPNPETKIRRQNNNDSTEGYVVYRVKNPTDILVSAWGEPGVKSLKISASPDGSKYTALDTTITKPVSVAGWDWSDHIANNIPEGTKYIKITIQKTGKYYNALQICQIVINCRKDADINGMLMADERITMQQKLLYGMGYFSDTDIKPEYIDDKATRSFYSSVIVKLLELDLYTPTVSISDEFTDISKDTQNIKEMSVLYEMGYLKGYSDGTFRANNPVRLEDVMTVAIAVLGYRELWDSDKETAVKFVNRMNVVENIKCKNANSITKNELINIIYEILHSNVILKNPTNQSFTAGDVLLDMYGIMKKEGQISKTIYGEISGDAYITDGTIAIDNEVYAIEDSLIHNNLGHTLTYYVNDEEEPQIIAYELNKDNVITVDAEELAMSSSEYSNKLVEYKVGSKTKKLKFDIKTLVKNGIRKNIPSYSDFDFKNGTITFIDTDEDKVYDVAIVEQYVNHIVETVFKDTNTVTDKYTYESVSLEEDNLYDNISIVKDNFPVDFSQIKANDVLSLVISDDNRYCKAIISSTTVNGTIKSTNSNKNSIKLDKDYKISQTYLSLVAINKAERLKAGLSGTFLIDAFGKIVGLGDVAGVSEYGYLLKAGVDDDVLCVRLYTKTEGIKDYCCKRKVNIVTGDTTTSMNAQDAYDKLVANAMSLAEDYVGTDPDDINAYFAEHRATEGFIKYKLNSNGEVSMITLPSLNTADEFNRTDVLDANGGFNAAYVNSADIIANQYSIKNAEWFVIPYDRTDETAYADTYALTQGYSGTYINYTMELYNCDEAGFADFVLIYLDENDGKNQDTETKAFAVIKGFSEAYNTKTDSVDTMVELIDAGTEVVYPLNKQLELVNSYPNDLGSKDISVLTPGDVIQYGLASDGTIGSVDLIYNVEDDIVKNGWSTYTSHSGDFMFYQNQVRIMAYGTVKFISNEYLTLDYGSGKNLSKISSAKVAVLNKTYGEARIGSIADVKVGDKVLIRSNAASVRELIVIED